MFPPMSNTSALGDSTPPNDANELFTVSSSAAWPQAA